ncbi:MAG: addiction module protein [Mangrovibacterium sp.]
MELLQTRVKLYFYTKNDYFCIDAFIRDIKAKQVFGTLIILIIMAHFRVTVPDNKAGFFKELLQSLSFKGEQTDDFELTEAQKSILDQRLENYKNNPGSYLDWEDVQKDIEKRL